MIPEFIVIHHIGGSNKKPLADTSSFSLEQLNKLHRKRFNTISSLGYYVAYNYYILQDGTLIQTRSDNERDMDALGYNFNSISICLQGNFDLDKPTKKQLKTLGKLISKKTKEHNITFDNILFHRDIAVKTCPGKNFTKKILWVNIILRSSIAQIISIIILYFNKKLLLE